MRGTKRELPDTSYSNSNLMNNLSQILNSATMGQPRRLRPLIGWTVAEYFFRGAPYGAMLLVVWEVFKPLQNPGTPLNLVNIGWACLMLLISLVCLWLISKKAYLVAYKDGYDICCDGRLEVVNHLRQLPMSFFNSRDPGDIGAYIVSDYNNRSVLWRAGDAHRRFGFALILQLAISFGGSSCHSIGIPHDVAHQSLCGNLGQEASKNKDQCRFAHDRVYTRYPPD